MPASPRQILEWDGSNWEIRQPATGSPNFLSQLGECAAYDEARGELVAYVNGVTSTWDGHELRALTPSQTPTASTGAGMAFDRVRDRVVLFGGSSTGYLNQTWEWDGANWALQSPPIMPVARRKPAIAWDEATQTVVIFGGEGISGPLSDTWSWDGSQWTMLQPATSPPGSSWQSMVYDRVRQKVVLVQTPTPSSPLSSMTTWEWDGIDWAQIATATMPTWVNEPSLAFDGASGAVLLAFGSDLNDPVGTTWTYDGVDWTLADVRPRYNFGTVVDDSTRGRLVMFDTALYGDHRTWEWDGVRWEAMTAANEPAVSTAGPMAYDPISQRVLIVGGNDNNAPIDDQWEWDGSSWTLTNPVVRPSARWQSAMAFDAARGQMVLFGGVNGSTFYGDTWLWNGSSWTQASPANQPPARRDARLAYDASRQRVVLSGGRATSSFSDTWEWDGFNWTEVVTPGPALNWYGRWSFYDETLQRVIVVGSALAGTGRETWSWDGASWTLMGSGPLLGLAMTYDSTRQQAVAVDHLATTVGRTTPSSVASVVENGLGCAGSNGVPTLAERGRPFLGNSQFLLELGSGRQNSIAAFVVGETTANVPLGGCTIAIGSPNSALLLLTNDYGFGELAIPIPMTLGLMGYAFSAQGIVLDPMGAGAGLLAATAELRITVGN